MDSTSLLELLRRRRSIRKFTSEPVAREALDRILEAGRWAPSGANRQPWLFLVVEDAQAKAEIRKHAEAADARWHAKAPAWLKSFFEHYEITATKEFLTQAPYLVCVFGERGNPYWRESAWLAIGQMLAAATAEVLGTLTYTPGQTSYLNRILGVAERFVPLAILPIGHAAETPTAESRPRKSIDHVVRFATDWKPALATTTGPVESYIGGIADSRLAYSTYVELAAILQDARSSTALLPQLARAITKLVPADEVELALQTSALRCEVNANRVHEEKPHALAQKPAADGGRATVPLSINGQIFGSFTLEREEPFTPLELEALIDASRVMSLGLWSRFSQQPRA